MSSFVLTLSNIFALQGFLRLWNWKVTRSYIWCRGRLSLLLNTVFS